MKKTEFDVTVNVKLGGKTYKREGKGSYDAVENWQDIKAWAGDDSGKLVTAVNEYLQGKAYPPESVKLRKELLAELANSPEAQLENAVQAFIGLKASMGTPITYDAALAIVKQLQ